MPPGQMVAEHGFEAGRHLPGGVAAAEDEDARKRIEVERLVVDGEDVPVTGEFSAHDVPRVCGVDTCVKTVERDLLRRRRVGVIVGHGW